MKLLRLFLFACLPVLTSFALAPAKAATLNLRDAPFSAAGDGVTNDWQPLARALSSLKAGDTLLVPQGKYRINLTQAPLMVPAGATVKGQNGQSKFLLFSDGDKNAHREFLRFNSDVTLQGLTVERADDFSLVMFPILGALNNVTFRTCRIDGNTERFPTNYCHGIQVGVGTLKSLLLDTVTVVDCRFGLFMQNAATGTVDGITVTNSTFARNTASDLEFNAPSGTMRNVTVQNCTFRDNRSKSPSAGFAVGFANVQNGLVENCQITNYGSEALHVEDRSSDIRLIGNTIVGGSLIQNNAVILVINASKNIVIQGNHIDARSNKNKVRLVMVTSGGAKFARPDNVTISDNVLLNGAKSESWYLQRGSSASPKGNRVSR